MFFFLQIRHVRLLIEMIMFIVTYDFRVILHYFAIFCWSQRQEHRLLSYTKSISQKVHNITSLVYNNNDAPTKMQTDICL